MKIDDKSLVRFDWAFKRLLRDKANFSILEGFLTTLLGRPIKIIEIIESEGNKEFDENKSNRVDLLAKEEDGSKIIIEVQNETEDSYFHRMLFGSSKFINDFMETGKGYENVTKIYSINIVYFRLGEGTDYIYHGITEFRGLHNHELLKLTPKLQSKFKVKEISDIFPEYYILKVNDFDKVAKEPLDQWMYFLRHSKLPENVIAPGLKEAGEKLKVISLSQPERDAYFHYMDNMVSLDAVIDSAYTNGVWDGKLEGLKEGIAQGREEGIAQGREEGIAQGREEGIRQGIFSVVKRMLSKGMSISEIAEIANLTEEEIKAIKNTFN